jgi:prepilin-type N-terminal cleavage/methylation domain-containing protein
MKIFRLRTAYQSPHLEYSRWGGLQRGVTLVEMLLVIVIVGIIMAAGLSTFAQQSRFSSVKQIASQLQGDLEDLRSKTIRYNKDATFTLDASGKTYTLKIPSSSGIDTVIRSLPDGILITPEGSTTKTFDYSAPFSQVSAAPRAYKVLLADISVFIKVIGVTGRAVQSATN